METINTKECLECKFGSKDDKSKILKVRCSKRERSYIYGQVIPCDDKEIDSEKS